MIYRKLIFVGALVFLVGSACGGSGGSDSEGKGGSGGGSASGGSGGTTGGSGGTTGGSGGATGGSGGATGGSGGATGGSGWATGGSGWATGGSGGKNAAGATAGSTAGTGGKNTAGSTAGSTAGTGGAATGGAAGNSPGGSPAQPDAGAAGGAVGGQDAGAPDSSSGGAGGSAGTGGSVGTKSAGCGKSITQQDAKTQKTLSVNGTTRYYLVYTPAGWDNNTPMPMVFALHGMNMNNWWAANDASGFNLITASANKAVLVYPQGTGDAPGTTSKWGNITSSWADGATGADEKFIDALLQSMKDTYCVDTSRIFVTGFSMGGMMTESLACDHSKVFRAFAPVAGWGPGGFGGMTTPNCSDSSVAVPILITQGSADTTVKPAYGEASRDFWIKRNGCTSTTRKMTVASGGASCVAYQGCKDGLAVDYCTHSGAHMVPNNAGSYIWSFFSSL